MANAADGNVRRILRGRWDLCRCCAFVMPGLVPGINVLGAAAKVVDGRDKPGHDGESRSLRESRYFPCLSTLSFSFWFIS